MATIYAMPNQDEWNKARGLDRNGELDPKGKWDTSKEEALYKALPQDKIIRFGVADGHAEYLVVSLKPLVLCHIPYGDAYRAHRLIEKALTAKEVRKLLKPETK